MLLAITNDVFSQTLSLPQEVTGEVGAFIRVTANTDCAVVKWYALDTGLNLFPVDLLRDTKVAVVTAPKAGRYHLLAYGAKGDAATDPAVCVVTVGEVPPVPPGPGPGPGPGPDPFGGGMTAVPAFRCLIVYESADLSKLPPVQAAVLTSGAVRDYLNAKAVVGPDGRTKEWRVWDVNVNTAAVSPMWQKVMARPRKSLPWIVIGNGSAGFEGPLPGTIDETLALLRTYGGN